MAALNDLWPRIVSAGVDVILDFGFWTRAARDEARALATSAGGVSRLYWLRCDDSIAARRVRERNADPKDSFYLSEESFEFLRTKYAPLDDDEEFVLIETGG
jgi:predicted kinase